MNDKHLGDELSAYLDGEAEDPDQVARHLRECPECARHYAQLAKFSEGLRAVPGPEVHPAFLTRVMAEVAETRTTRARAWSLRLVLLAAAAGVVLVVLGLAALLDTAPRSGPQDYAVTKELMRADDGVLIAAIEPYVSLEEDPEEFLVAYSIAPYGSGAFGDDDLLDGLASADWFDDFAEVWDQRADLDAMLASLDDEEAETLRELLNEYAQEDWTI